MFGCRVLFGSLLAGVVVACGGSVDRLEPSAGGDGSGTGGSAPSAGAGTGGRAGAGTGGLATGGAVMGGNAGVSGVAGGRPVGPGCPDVDAPPPEVECDAFAAVNTCGLGFGCYPFVSHPFGDGCDTQVYGTQCAPAGTAKVGGLCGADVGESCEPGSVCVIGQRPGKRCARLCTPGAMNSCTDGLICSDLDVQGFGVCG